MARLPLARARLGRKAKKGLTPTQGTIQLSAATIAADAANPTTIGTLSVSPAIGSYTYTLSSNPGSQFGITGALLRSAAVLTAGSYSVGVHADNGAGDVLDRSFLVTVTPTLADGAWPGQAGNLVGHAGTPASASAEFTAAHGGTWPGAYSSLTAWPGGTGNKTINNGTYATSGSGTSGDPYVFAFYDFDAGTGQTSVSVSNAIFVGCRFQSNNAPGANCQVTGANVTFDYCSFVPRTALYSSPPGYTLWPSAGTGVGTITQTNGVNGIDGNSGFQAGLSIPDGAGPIMASHCDCWGMGNSFSQMGSTTAQLTFKDCWVHDAANQTAQEYHQDGIGYVNGGAAPKNIRIEHCVIASLGNTNGIAFQSASSPYDRIAVVGNYITGWGLAVDMCHNVSGNTNLTFTDNVIATDIQWVYGPLYNDGSVPFALDNTNGNVWARNTLSVYPGSSALGGAGFTYTSGDDGKFILPNSAISATDWDGTTGSGGGDPGGGGGTTTWTVGTPQYTAGLLGSSATSATVTAPSGLADGDYIYVAIACDIPAGGDPGAASISGFTEVSSHYTAAYFQGSLRLTVLRKRASSESGDYTASWASSARFAWCAVGIRGAVLTGTPEDQVATQNAANSVSIVAPSLTTLTGADDLLVCAFAHCGGSNPYTMDAGLTTISNNNQPNSDAVFLGVGYKALTSNAATGTFTAVASGGNPCEASSVGILGKGS